MKCRTITLGTLPLFSNCLLSSTPATPASLYISIICCRSLSVLYSEHSSPLTISYTSRMRNTDKSTRQYRAAEVDSRMISLRLDSCARIDRALRLV